MHMKRFTYFSALWIHTPKSISFSNRLSYSLPFMSIIIPMASFPLRMLFSGTVSATATDTNSRSVIKNILSVYYSFLFAKGTFYQRPCGITNTVMVLLKNNYFSFYIFYMAISILYISSKALKAYTVLGASYLFPFFTKSFLAISEISSSTISVLLSSPYLLLSSINSFLIIAKRISLLSKIFFNSIIC